MNKMGFEMKMWIWIGAGVYYALTALAVYIQAHDEIEDEKYEQSEEFMTCDIVNQMFVAVLWPLHFGLMPLCILWDHLMDYINYSRANEQIQEMNKEKDKNRRHWPLFP